MLTLTWLGHACFKVESDGYTIVIDPYTGVQGYAEFQTSANAVLCSHDHGDHSHRAAVTLKDPDAPSPFKLTVLPAHHDDRQGALRGEVVIHLLETPDGLRLAHLGDLGHMPDEATLAALRGVDALMLPVGGHYTIDARTAHAIIEATAPRVAIPMHYRRGSLGFPVLSHLSEFLDLCEDIVEYCGNGLEIDGDTPVQTAVLQYLPPQQ